jgi:hypothetical protein
MMIKKKTIKIKIMAIWIVNKKKIKKRGKTDGDFIDCEE